LIFTSGADINQTVNVSTTAGNIRYTASGSIIMQDGVSTRSNNAGNGLVEYVAAQNVTMSQVISDKTVNITATNGSVTDGLSGTNPNIQAVDANLVAAAGIGTNSAFIYTTVEQISLNSSASGAWIMETDALKLSASTLSSDLVVSSGAMEQAGNLTSSNGSVSLKSSGTIVMGAGTATTVNNKTIGYESASDMGVSILNAGTGNVTLKTSTTHEIYDVANNTSNNVTAATLNMIGHGVFGKGAKFDDVSIKTLESRAIDTNVSRVYVASSVNSEGVLQILPGPTTSALLKEANQWSVQLVNQGLFMSSGDMIASDLSITKTGFQDVEAVEYIRYLDLQMLNDLSSKSGSITNSTPVGRILEINNLNRMNRIDFEQDIFSSDYSESVEMQFNGVFNELSIMPDFSDDMATFSLMDTDDVLVFDYWTEDILI
jgi:hypothetical protein